jgi:hypothetical protein
VCTNGNTIDPGEPYRTVSTFVLCIFEFSPSLDNLAKRLDLPSKSEGSSEGIIGRNRFERANVDAHANGESICRRVPAVIIL